MNEKINPLEKLMSLNLLFLVPPTYAIVIGNKDKEHGPRLVKRPAEKTKNTVNGLGWYRPCSINKLPFWANSEITKLIDVMWLIK